VFLTQNASDITRDDLDFEPWALTLAVIASLTVPRQQRQLPVKFLIVDDIGFQCSQGLLVEFRDRLALMVKQQVL